MGITITDSRSRYTDFSPGSSGLITYGFILVQSLLVNPVGGHFLRDSEKITFIQFVHTSHHCFDNILRERRNSRPSS